MGKIFPPHIQKHFRQSHSFFLSSPLTVPAKYLATMFPGNSFHIFQNPITCQFHPHSRTPLYSLLFLQQTALIFLHVGSTTNSIARRIIHLRGETKAANGPLTAPVAVEEAQTPFTSMAAAVAAAVRNLPPPGAATQTRWSPDEPFRSPITGKWFALAAAPKRHKRTRTDDDDEADEDDGAIPAPKRLRWNIHDDYAREHRMAKRATKRAKVLRRIKRENPVVIDLDTPSTATSNPDTEGSGSSPGTASTFDRP